MRAAQIYWLDKLAGELYEVETETGLNYIFTYDNNYFTQNNPPISLTLPTNRQKYESNSLFAFFDGLIPEGWLLNIASKNWKLNPNDRMGLLLACCKDCIGCVSVQEIENTKNVC